MVKLFLKMLKFSVRNRQKFLFFFFENLLGNESAADFIKICPKIGTSSLIPPSKCQKGYVLIFHR